VCTPADSPAQEISTSPTIQSLLSSCVVIEILQVIRDCAIELPDRKSREFMV
jgi:hypothetical protein